MKLLIAGSRSIDCFDLERYVPKATTLIISGGAKGIDSLAEAYADKHRISKLILRPRYSTLGKAAPLRRNRRMVDLADAVLLIWDGSSPGTRSTARYAMQQHKPTVSVLLCPHAPQKAMPKKARS